MVRLLRNRNRAGSGLGWSCRHRHRAAWRAAVVAAWVSCCLRCRRLAQAGCSAAAALRNRPPVRAADAGAVIGPNAAATLLHRARAIGTFCPALRAGLGDIAHAARGARGHQPRMRSRPGTPTSALLAPGAIAHPLPASGCSRAMRAGSDGAADAGRAPTATAAPAAPSAHRPSRPRRAAAAGHQPRRNARPEDAQRQQGQRGQHDDDEWSMDGSAGCTWNSANRPEPMPTMTASTSTLMPDDTTLPKTFLGQEGGLVPEPNRHQHEARQRRQLELDQRDESWIASMKHSRTISPRREQARRSAMISRTPRQIPPCRRSVLRAGARRRCRFAPRRLARLHQFSMLKVVPLAVRPRPGERGRTRCWPAS